ncbi:dethiobiotin synthase [Marinomonas agarivorans]|nr:dethiobiotin synthase [Marinomonas agarivorans]
MTRKKQYFITGTDTDAGKTYFSSGLLAAGVRRQLKSIGLKPVAAGADYENGVLRNDDALALMASSNTLLPYEQVNPVVLRAPVSPHIAAKQENKIIRVAQLTGYVKGALITPHDLAVVEGAGGWRVPLNDREMMSDLALSLSLPVILVVNMKLGCINHAMLTAESILRDGLPLVGWIANGKDKMLCYEENIQTLIRGMPAPFLGELSYSDEHNASEFDVILAKLLGDN